MRTKLYCLSILEFFILRWVASMYGHLWLAVRHIIASYSKVRHRHKGVWRRYKCRCSDGDNNGVWLARSWSKEDRFIAEMLNNTGEEVGWTRTYVLYNHSHSWNRKIILCVIFTRIICFLDSTSYQSCNLMQFPKILNQINIPYKTYSVYAAWNNEGSSVLG